MTPPALPPAPDIATAEQILAATFGGPVQLGPAEALRDRVTIFRCPVLAGPSAVPASVILKSATPHDDRAYDPADTAPRALATRLFNEWAGLQFLQTREIAPPVAPRFYGGDRARGLIVLEDLGTGQGLDHLLLASDPAAAQRGLIELAAALGRMHASTSGQSTAYLHLRNALGPRVSTDRETYGWLATAVDDAGATLDLPPAPGAAAELTHLIAALRDPGPFLAYIHGDPCPDNWLDTADGLRLMDFEYGGVHHALLDGVYGRIHFPTCWCVNRLPEALPLQMEATYRTALIPGCPAATDDTLFYRAVVEACVYWAITTTKWGPLSKLLEQDTDWGVATVRQRVVLRYALAAQITAEHGHLEALGATLGALAARLRILWPEAATLPLYPAFR